MISDIYLDVDEVIAAWVRAALALFELDEKSVFETWATFNPRPWDVFDVLGMPHNKVWRKIDAAGETFWSNIEPFPWMHELIELCQNYAPVTLLTSGSKHSSSYGGKAEWIHEHLGAEFPKAICNDKWRFAHPGALLIDDRPKNCEEFRRRGKAILFPSFGNEKHSLAGDPIPHIRSQLLLHFR